MYVLVDLLVQVVEECFDGHPAVAKRLWLDSAMFWIGIKYDPADPVIRSGKPAQIGR